MRFGGSLGLGDGGGEVCEDGYKFWSSRMFQRDVVEGIDDAGGNMPAVGAAPEVGGEAGGFVGPFLRLAVVVAVEEKARLGIARMCSNELDLRAGFVDEFRVIKRGAGFGHERAGHEDAIEPHLMRVDLLVPESAIRISRLTGDLFEQVFNRFLISQGVG